METNIRLEIWDWILKTAKHPENQILSFWLRMIYAVLFPLQFFYWKMSEKHGYEARTDTWRIHGQRYTGELFRHFAVGGNEWFKITGREGGLVKIERIPSSKILFNPDNLIKAVEKLVTEHTISEDEIIDIIKYLSILADVGVNIKDLK